MAPPVADLRRGVLADLAALFAAMPERAEFALRLATICALTLFVVEYYGTPEPALTIYIVFFLNRSDRTTSLILNVALVIVVSLVLATTLGLAMGVVDDPGWRVATMALVSFGFLFLASASKLRPIGAILALIVAYALDLLGEVPMGELATRALLYAWLFVGIPAGVSLVVNLLIAPAPRRQIEKALARRLRAAARGLEERGERGTRLLAWCRETGVAEILHRLHLAGVERTLPAADAAALASATRATPVLLAQVEVIRETPAIPADWKRAAAATLDGMAAILERGGYPVRIAPPPAPALEEAQGQRLIDDFAGTLAGYAQSAPPVARAEPEAGGFFLPDAFSNPAHVRYAVKTTAAAMFCYLLYQILDWPGIHTSLITCYIVSLGTAAETVEKLGLRILGCLVGAAAGLGTLVWLVPDMTTIWALMAVVFLAMLGAGLVAAASPRINYAGFQIAFAFLLCVVQGTGPAFDLTIARDRIIGILIGNTVSYLILTRIWPASMGHRIDPALRALLREIATLARAPQIERRWLAPALRTRLSEAGGDLALVEYEPRRLRPPPSWVAARRRVLAALVALETPLLVEDSPAFWQDVADRLERLAAGHASFAVGAVVPPATGVDQTTEDTVSLQTRVRRQLAIVEQNLAP